MSALITRSVSASLVENQFGNIDFRLNAIRGNRERVVRSGETVNKNLPRLDRLAGKLIGCQLGQSAQAGRFETHRSQIRKPQITRMPDRTDRIQSQSFDAHGKCTKRGLAADLDLTVQR